MTLRIFSYSEVMNMHLPKEPVVRINWETQTIDIFGGDSGYLEDDPYWIGFDRLNEDWLFHLAEKTWVTPLTIARLAKALQEAKERMEISAK